MTEARKYAMSQHTTLYCSYHASIIDKCSLLTQHDPHRISFTERTACTHSIATYVFYRSIYGGRCDACIWCTLYGGVIKSKTLSYGNLKATRNPLVVIYRINIFCKEVLSCADAFDVASIFCFCSAGSYHSKQR